RRVAERLGLRLAVTDEVDDEAAGRLALWRGGVRAGDHVAVAGGGISIWIGGGVHGAKGLGAVWGERRQRQRRGHGLGSREDVVARRILFSNDRPTPLDRVARLHVRDRALPSAVVVDVVRDAVGQRRARPAAVLRLHVDLGRRILGPDTDRAQVRGELVRGPGAVGAADRDDIAGGGVQARVLRRDGGVRPLADLAREDPGDRRGVEANVRDLLPALGQVVHEGGTAGDNRQ